MEFDDFDEDDEFYSPPPHPDDRLWRHPAEVAAEARNAAPFAGHEEPPMLARVASRWPLALAAVGAGVVFTMLGVTQLFATGAGVASIDNPGTGDGSSIAIDTLAPPVGGSEASWDRNLRSLVEPSIPTIEVVRGVDKTTGRGIFIAESGYIMTSARLVDSADLLRIRTSSDYYIAEFIGADPLTDVAVIRITNASEKDHTHPVVALGEAAILRTGQPLLAMANGDSKAINVATVTNTHNAVTLSSGELSYGFVQVSLPPAVFEPGAAVFNELGTAVGMVPSMAAVDTQASLIPIDIAHSVATSLISGALHRPWLGVGVTEASSPGRISGSIVQISELYDEGPALGLGIQVHDRFVSIGGDPITTISDLLRAVWSHQPGDEIEVGILRGTEHKLVNITLGVRPTAATPADQ